MRSAWKLFWKSVPKSFANETGHTHSTPGRLRVVEAVRACRARSAARIAITSRPMVGMLMVVIKAVIGMALEGLLQLGNQDRSAWYVPSRRNRPQPNPVGRNRHLGHGERPRHYCRVALDHDTARSVIDVSGCGASERRIQRAINHLVERGLIARVKRRSRQTGTASKSVLLEDAREDRRLIDQAEGAFTSVLVAPRSAR